MKLPLTRRQKEVLDFIEVCIAESGYPPTLREIGEYLGIKSTNGVNDHLKALEKKGYIVRGSMKSRALRLVNLSGPVVEVPLLGHVHAGELALAVEEHEATVRIDRFLLGPSREVFALRVKGDSMIEDGIHDGDFIFVTKSLTADKGDTVVVMVEGEATVKRFYPEGDRIRLQPANAAMDPIILHRSQFRSIDLLGVVVGVFRKVR